MPLDQETRAELKALVREALREELDANGGGVNVPLPLWQYGDALTSPPRADGAVKLKFVEEELVGVYGATVPYVELTTAGPVNHEAVIPRWYFVPESRTTDTARVNVGSAAFRQNRAYGLKQVSSFWGTHTDEGEMIADAFASQFDYAGLRLRMLHRAASIAKGTFNTFYALRDDELDIG